MNNESGEGVTKKRFRTFKEINILIALIVLCTIIAIINPRFLTPFNLQVVARQIAIYGLLAIGETLVIITGGIDLSVGSLVALTGVIVALLMKSGINMYVSILLVLILSSLIGLWHGTFVTKLKVPPFIITLGTLTAARGLASVITKGWPILGLPEKFFIIGQGEILGIPISLIILLVFAFITFFITKYTVLGRQIYAIGGNIEAARLSGIDVDKRTIFCYISSSFLAGVTGIIIASRLSQGQAGVGSGYELNAIAASVIGGTSLSGGEGSILGALIGAAIMSTIDDGLILLEVSSYWHDVVMGLVIVAAVTLDILRKRQKI
ncbi:MAG TPA: ABC transporter permease [Dictyoglomaceae bacterium]|nr:ABC transporter permease [Dictyoglomaceae bacterium]HOL39661.1 ABC transporter permease [Dictyoglomaceae bacterium]HOP94803.1 ABC transporter permease [Dictyoglomaceae bacterium]HPP16070.1 ABC transporter permease [Dictyoglomaceae bacterium]HPU43302.1 ABC transporter permease [Dictyoglomaceae bacterium]